jgi:hypothetical protein
MLETRMRRPLAPIGWIAWALACTLSACREPPRSPPCDVATFLCFHVPCDDGGAPGPDNCARIDVACDSALALCAREAEVRACIGSLAGGALSCPDVDACFTRVGCRYEGLRLIDAGASTASVADAGE